MHSKVREYFLKLFKTNVRCKGELTCIMPMSIVNETAISIFLASSGVQEEPVGWEGGAIVELSEEPVGAADRFSSKDMFCNSRSITCATIRQITAKLPVKEEEGSTL